MYCSLARDSFLRKRKYLTLLRYPGLESLLDWVDDLDLNKEVDYSEPLDDDWSDPASSILGLDHSLESSILYEL